MATRDLQEFFDNGALDYPGVKSKTHPDGKTYRVPSPSGPVGAFLTASLDFARAAALSVEPTDKDLERLNLDDEQELTLYQLVLGCTTECAPHRKDCAEGCEDHAGACGSVYDQMMADGVPWTTMQMIGRDALMCFGTSIDEANAQLAVRSGEAKGPAEAETQPNRADRRAEAKSTRQKGRSSSPAAGSKSRRTSSAKNTPATSAEESTPESRTTADPSEPAGQKAS